jgi:hypothetical protein
MTDLKNDIILFNKWLFDNNFIPNNSFLWFDHTKSIDEILFFELEELFDAFNNVLTIEELIQKKNNDIKIFFNKYCL